MGRCTEEEISTAEATIMCSLFLVSIEAKKKSAIGELLRSRVGFML